MLTKLIKHMSNKRHKQYFVVIFSKPCTRSCSNFTFESFSLHGNILDINFEMTGTACHVSQQEQFWFCPFMSHKICQQAFENSRFNSGSTERCLPTYTECLCCIENKLIVVMEIPNSAIKLIPLFGF